MLPKASVIIPVRNGEKVLPRCLKALAEQNIDQKEYEIIVVDDGSTDGTAAVAEARGATVVSQPPSGPAAARNRGAEVAQGEILLFTDADCAPLPDWISRMLAAFQRPDVTGAKGIYQSAQRSLTARFVQREYESKYRRMQNFDSIDFIDTYSAGFRKGAFLKAGGYDPAFETASVEDQEFSFRLHRQGAKMVFVPDAVVDHLHVDRFSGYFRKKFKIGFYKALLLLRHPGKAKGDSHTPRSLQVQMAALFGAVFFFVLGFLASPLFWLALICAAVFVVSAIPFSVRLAVTGDWCVLVIAPFLLVVRALALGLGLMWGLFYFNTIARTEGKKFQQTV